MHVISTFRQNSLTTLGPYALCNLCSVDILCVMCLCKPLVYVLISLWKVDTSSLTMWFSDRPVYHLLSHCLLLIELLKCVSLYILWSILAQCTITCAKVLQDLPLPPMARTLDCVHLQLPIFHLTVCWITTHNTDCCEISGQYKCFHEPVGVTIEYLAPFWCSWKWRYTLSPSSRVWLAPFTNNHFWKFPMIECCGLITCLRLCSLFLVDRTFFPWASQPRHLFPVWTWSGPGYFTWYLFDFWDTWDQ